MIKRNEEKEQERLKMVHDAGDERMRDIVEKYVVRPRIHDKMGI